MCVKKQNQDGEVVVSTKTEGKHGVYETDQSQMTMVKSDVYKQHELNDGEEVHL